MIQSVTLHTVWHWPNIQEQFISEVNPFQGENHNLKYLLSKQNIFNVDNFLHYLRYNFDKLCTCISSKGLLINHGLLDVWKRWLEKSSANSQRLKYSGRTIYWSPATLYLLSFRVKQLLAVLHCLSLAPLYSTLLHTTLHYTTHYYTPHYTAQHTTTPDILKVDFFCAVKT